LIDLVLSPTEELEDIYGTILRDGDALIAETYIPSLGPKGSYLWGKASPLYDAKGDLVGAIESIRDITDRKRSEQLLNALNKAAIAMGTALTLEDIFTAVARELEKLGFSCMLFPMDESQERLLTKYVGYESKALETAEKLVGIKHENFSIRIDDFDEYKKVVRERKTILIEDSSEMARRALPKPVKMLAPQMVKILNMPRFIPAPLIIDDKVVGVFSVQSDDLTKRDIPAVTAFALQISAAWYKANLVLKLKKSLDERERAEEALRLSEERYRLLVESSNEAIVVAQDGMLKYVNPKAVEITGYSERELTSRPFMELIHPDDREMVVDRHQRRLTGEGPIPVYAFRIVEKGERTRWVEINAVLIEWEGRPATLNFLSDITERKQAEKELYRRGSLLSSVAVAANELLVSTDFDDSINRTMETIGLSVEADRVYIFENHDDPGTGEHLMSQRFEWSRETVEAQMDNPALKSLSYDRFFPIWYQKLSSGEVVKGLVKDRPASERAILEPQGIRSILVVPIMIDDQFWGYIGFDDCHSDRSWSDSEVSILLASGGSIGGAIMRHRAETALRNAHAELELRVKERTEELERRTAEMERFIYTVSHDLRSPLITVSNLVGFLKKDLDKGDRQQIETDLRWIEEAVIRMDALLGETLELSRIGRVINPPEDFPFREIVGEALLQTAETLKSKAIEVSVAHDLPAVHVDRMRIVEVLVNLIENSVRYMGGQSEPKIEIGHRLDDAETVFFVRDNGIGIDPSQHEKVFGLFYKVDRKSDGTGAGLAIAKRIIEVHGGRIWIESKLGKGCTVCFTLLLA
jgi:PAS domain S-box-containing protein